MIDLVIEILDKKAHDIKSFDCGEKEMNVFLKQFAIKNQKLRISKSWGVFDKNLLKQFKENNQKTKLIGYFTLTPQSIEPDLIKDEKFPNYSLPVILLARLAIDINFQNQGLGEKVFFLVLKKALEISNNYGGYALVLEVLNEKAFKFYQKFDFLKQLGDFENKLYVSINKIEHIFNPN